MIETREFNAKCKPSSEERRVLIDFLFEHLQDYTDPVSDIEKTVEYVLKETRSFGGFILVLYAEKIMVGVVVVAKTGMVDFIPENLLVYIATHKDYRGKGYGRTLMQKAIDLADGSIALHVEPRNPAIALYEKMGFSSKYIEMRYKKQK